MRERAGTFIAALLVIAAGLSGCSDLRKALGYDKSAPDEFRVVSRAPLAVPTEFDLPVPVPGAARPQDTDPRQQAIAAVLGKRSAAQLREHVRGKGEAEFLRLAGGDAVEPDIRRVVDDETKALALEERTITDRIVFWRKNDDNGPLVDPEKESTRLRENQALGRPTTDGETPSIKRRPKALLEGLF